jgi:hypothetical protein
MSLIYLWSVPALVAAFLGGMAVGSRMRRRPAHAPSEGVESLQAALEENDREIAQLRFELAARRPSEIRIPVPLGGGESRCVPTCEVCNPDNIDDELLHGPAWKVTLERILVSLEPDDGTILRPPRNGAGRTGWWAPQDSNL